jgi:hypothetical protein
VAQGPFGYDDLTAVAVELAGALERVGRHDAAARVRRAATMSFDREALLELRSVMVATRRDWDEAADASLRSRASRALHAAKRLAIDL